MGSEHEEVLDNSIHFYFPFYSYRGVKLIFKTYA